MNDQVQHTLEELREIRERSRRLAHGGQWLPVLLLAALLLASMLLYQHPFTQPRSATIWRHFWAGLPAGERSVLAAYLYWFAGLPLVVLGTGAWYRWRGRRVGMTVAWSRYAAVTLAALALLAILAALPITPRASIPPGWSGLLTPLLVVAVAIMALGLVERSRGLLLAGIWVGLVTAWHCSLGMGRLPGWLVWLLEGGEGPALGGQLTLLGLHRPGPVLMLMALPLLVAGARGAWRARGAGQ
ncbi:hypothetical protein [Amycolatopsis aidingensis]|uniref:hypothetical protein n=1 Tax=Amycolatopsis aidingensis TaxID=2842453 RepID=UPI001C0C271D|nr:hypothetical protein [Amycolatopsis aidingensis]